MNIPKLKQTFSKLNPANSLFGKIFIWFWLSVTTLLICAFILARLTRAGIDIAEPSESQLKQSHRVASFVQMAMDRGSPPERALGRVANRGKWQLMLVGAQNQDVILGFPAPMLPAKKPIIELAASEQIVLARTPTIDFVGPFEISAGDEGYKLFVGRLLRRDERRPQSLALGLILIVSIGSLLCVLLAWRLTIPLRSLGLASRAFAAGDMQIKAGEHSNRRDEIGKLASDFNAMAAKINASMQQQNMLLANVSHELRTPLTRLQLAGALLQDKYTQDEYLNRYLSRIELEIVTMDKLIGQILKLSRMQNAKSGLGSVHEQKLEALSLIDALSQTIENLEFEAKANDIQLLCEPIPNRILMLNQEALASALENITRNAIEHADACVWISIEQNDTHMRVNVDDDGEGLHSQELARLFEPFYQATNKQATNKQATNKQATNKQETNKSQSQVKGSGLGLAIAKVAVALNGGDLVAQPSSKGGLCLSIILPLAPIE